MYLRPSVDPPRTPQAVGSSTSYKWDPLGTHWDAGGSQGIRAPVTMPVILQREGGGLLKIWHQSFTIDSDITDHQFLDICDSFWSSVGIVFVCNVVLLLSVG